MLKIAIIETSNFSLITELDLDDINQVPKIGESLIIPKNIFSTIYDSYIVTDVYNNILQNKLQKNKQKYDFVILISPKKYKRNKETFYINAINKNKKEINQ